MADQDTPHPIDLHVGARVRVRRKLLGISQEKLADHLGLTFQQIQKYERGANRVSASKLFEIGQALSAPVSYFFEGLDQPDAPTTPDVMNDFFQADGALELAQAFATIPRAKRRDFLKMASAGASMAGDQILEPA